VEVVIGSRGRVEGTGREQAGWQAGTQTSREADSQTSRQPSILTSRWLGIPAGRQTGTRQPDGQFPEADRQRLSKHTLRQREIRQARCGAFKHVKAENRGAQKREGVKITRVLAI